MFIPNDLRTDTAENVQSLRESSTAGVRPTTIRQLLDATRQHASAPFHIDGIEAKSVSVVAHVVRVRNYATSVMYDLEDGTSRGHIIGKQWTSDMIEPHQTARPEPYYVHVIGQLDRSEQESRNSLKIEKIRILADDPVDQICFHLLEAAFVTMAYERGPPPPSALAQTEPRRITAPPHSHIEAEPSITPVPTTPDARSRVRSPTTPSTPVTPFRLPATPSPRNTIRQPVPVVASSHTLLTNPRSRGTPEPQAPAGPVREATPPASPWPPPSPPPATPPPAESRHQGSSRGNLRDSGIRRDPYAHLSALQRAILLQILNAPISEKGLSVVLIVRGISHHDVTAAQIGDALDSLLKQGHIETTSDESHYALKTSRYPTTF